MMPPKLKDELVVREVAAQGGERRWAGIRWVLT